MFAFVQAWFDVRSKTLDFESSASMIPTTPALGKFEFTAKLKLLRPAASFAVQVPPTDDSTD